MEAEINQKAAINSAANEGEKNIRMSIPALNLILLFCVIIFVGVNQILINDLNKKLGIEYNFKNKLGKMGNNGRLSSNVGSVAGKKIELVGDVSKDAINLIISKGTPVIYGQEMGISFDNVQSAINVMKQYDPYDLKPKGSRIIPMGVNFQRYIAVTGKISCEYCCSAISIINPKNGQFACGCAHSMAMRGLAAYLIEKHGSEYSNDEILREIARWKGVYFPKQMIKKMTEQLYSGKYTPDIAAMLLGLDLPKYSESSAGAPSPFDIENLPSMVGGC